MRPFFQAKNGGKLRQKYPQPREIHFFSVGLSCDIIVQSKAFITGFWF